MSDDTSTLASTALTRHWHIRCPAQQHKPQVYDMLLTGRPRQGISLTTLPACSSCNQTHLHSTEVVPCPCSPYLVNLIVVYIEAQLLGDAISVACCLHGWLSQFHGAALPQAPQCSSAAKSAQPSYTAAAATAATAAAAAAVVSQYAAGAGAATRPVKAASSAQQGAYQHSQVGKVLYHTALQAALD